jgi:hypothetical protein
MTGGSADLVGDFMDIRRPGCTRGGNGGCHDFRMAAGPELELLQLLPAHIFGLPGVIVNQAVPDMCRVGSIGFDVGVPAIGLALSIATVFFTNSGK